jgi:hypothetical protein
MDEIGSGWYPMMSFGFTGIQTSGTIINYLADY